ncbi:MFS transporter [Kaistia soli]|nr:MFS transporter [Kaistia soli]
MVTISALGVTQILAWGSTYYLPAVLAKPIAVDTGWPLSYVVGGLSVGLFAAGVVSPRVGRLIQQHGGRRILAASVVLMALGLLTIGLAPSIIVYLAGWIIIGCGAGAGLYDAAFATLGRYYGYGARSAITTLTLFGGFASTICWPLSAFLAEQLGWRGACFVYAGIHLAFCLPILIVLLPRAEPLPLSSAEDSEAVPKAVVEPRHRRAFLLLAIILTTGGVIATMLGVQLLTLLQDRGLSLAAAVGLGALIGPAQVASRLFDMLVGKRFAPIFTLMAATLLIAAGIVALTAGLPAVAGALIVYGAGNGIWSIARGALPLAMFGPELYPVLMGRLAMPSLVAQALSPFVGALLLEYAGASSLLGVLAIVACVNVGLTLLLWRTGATRRVPASGAFAGGTIAQ